MQPWCIRCDSAHCVATSHRKSLFFASDGKGVGAELATGVLCNSATARSRLLRGCNYQSTHSILSRRKGRNREHPGSAPGTRRLWRRETEAASKDPAGTGLAYDHFILVLCRRLRATGFSQKCICSATSSVEKRKEAIVEPQCSRIVFSIYNFLRRSAKNMNYTSFYNEERNHVHSVACFAIYRYIPIWSCGK